MNTPTIAVPPDTACKTCHECGGEVRHTDDERICTECGLVLVRDRIDRGPDWRCLDDTGQRRTGAPVDRTRHDGGISTCIGYGEGTDITEARAQQLIRIRTLHNRSRFESKAERNRAYGFTEIKRIVSSRSLSRSIEEQACSLFESAQSEGLLSGRSIEGFSAGAVYAVCRVQSIPRTIEEIVAVARADRDELGVAYDALNRELGLPTGPISPLTYLPRYASELELANDIEMRAREYVDAIVTAGKLGGKNPSGVAAACLYMAAYDFGVDVTQTAAADVAGVSRMTIRSRITELKELD
ncbi:transcription initiation factor IIB [Natranaeroarchaeum aerophilus]|uniref:Transcription initiation factor IIB n=1 Tax=Natranaeroarchaeum aerophilus TaxID=2917711 RepID=A0AAE3K4T7_9EURY|nr:transcription initiation factor IIB family protein [Natranaeroarchaeum aerophilus]MCL9812890.1 transcription initiation factor IIB family protein [Natranaeroarchaeum aerophilus]